MTTLLSREFDLLDTIRLWDSLLADESRDEFVTYICCAMVLEQKPALMQGDFGENLSLVIVFVFLLALCYVHIIDLLSDAPPLTYSSRSTPL
jgi:hypothetical protein